MDWLGFFYFGLFWVWVWVFFLFFFSGGSGRNGCFCLFLVKLIGVRDDLKLQQTTFRAARCLIFLSNLCSQAVLRRYWLWSCPFFPVCVKTWSEMSSVQKKKTVYVYFLPNMLKDKTETQCFHRVAFPLKRGSEPSQRKEAFCFHQSQAFPMKAVTSILLSIWCTIQRLGARNQP